MRTSIYKIWKRELIQSAENHEARIWKAYHIHPLNGNHLAFLVQALHLANLALDILSALEHTHPISLPDKPIFDSVCLGHLWGIQNPNIPCAVGNLACSGMACRLPPWRNRAQFPILSPACPSLSNRVTIFSKNCTSLNAKLDAVSGRFFFSDDPGLSFGL